MPSWDLIRAFLALHRAGAYEAAAQQLKIDHCTLRRRIQALEQSIGTPLFTRRDNRYVVLPSVRSLLEAAIQMDGASRSFFDMAPDGQSGNVRITIIDVFAHWLAPDFAEFHRQNAGIVLDITTEHDFVDLESELVDIAIRLARPTRGKARLRRLAEVAHGVYAAPSYLEKRANEPRDYGHDLLALAVHFMHRDHEFFASEADWLLQHLPPGKVVCAVDSYPLLRDYCAEGMGLALLPRILGDTCDRLTRVPTAGASEPSCDLWLVLHSETGSTPCVRVVADYLAHVFTRRARELAPGHLALMDGELDLRDG